MGDVTTVVVPSGFVAEHVSMCPEVGPGIVMSVKHVLLVAPETCQCRTTLFPKELPRYHPFVPAMPSIVYVIVGGLAADVGTTTSEAAMTTAARSRRRT
jgi:hypothetical protein